jgi:Major Facilitator Superfamily
MADPGAAAAQRRRRVATAILAVVVLNLPLGTIYTFSVFLRPLEAELGLTRAQLSFVFGCAVVAFTVGMNLAPMLYRLAPAAALVAGCSALAATGMALASGASGIVGLTLGYGALFGLGGGAVYVLTLQGLNLMVRGRRGLLNGFVVSLYPLGAMIGAPLFGWALELWGLRGTLACLALVLAATGALAIGLLLASGMRLTAPEVVGAAAAAAPGAPPRPPEATRRGAIFWRLWAVFFLAAAAGLTVLSQAAGMVEAYGGSKGMALFATTAITGLIAATRIGGGWLADRFSAPAVMAGAHVLALAGDLSLLAFPGAFVSAATLAMIGMGYGLVSGSTAAAIAVYWSAAQYGRIAGRLYIAWCVAALTLPVAAGRLFDLTGGYHGAIALATAGNLLGILVAAGLPRRA